MRCFMCKKFTRGCSKYQLCSACQGRSIGTMIRSGLIDIDKLQIVVNTTNMEKLSLEVKNEK